MARVLGPNAVEVVTSGGKRRVVRTDDPRLHKAGQIESLILRLRAGKHFPAVSMHSAQIV